MFGLGVNNLGPVFPAVAMQQLSSGSDISLFTPDVLHEYLYVKDLAVIILKLIEMEDSWNNVFNVSGPKQSLFSLTNTIERYLKLNFASVGSVNKSGKEPGYNFYFDTSKLENLIGDNIYTPTEIVIDRMGEFLKSEID